MNNRIFERRLRFWLWVVRAYFRKHWLKIVGVIFCSFVVFGLGLKIISKLQPQAVYSEGIIGNFSEDNLPRRVTRLLSEGLTTLTSDGLLQPGLSNSWQVDNDGKIYRFRLRDNLFWHDATPVTSSDIDIKINGVEISYPDEKTLQFKLKDPYSPFPVTVSKPVFKKGSKIGTGQYRLGELEKVGETVKAVKLIPKNKKLPQIIFKFYPTFTQAVTAFKMGGVKALSNLSQTNSLSQWPNTKVVKTIDYTRIVGLFFNTKNPRFSHKETRQALAYGINKNGFQGEIAFSPIASNSWVYNPDVRHYEYDVKKANSLFEKVQFKKEEKIILSALSAYQDLAKKIAADWQALGLNVEIQIENLVPDDFQILLAGQEIPDDPDQYSLWHSTQSSNLTHLSNPRIDKLLEDGRSIQDPKERKAKYLEFQKLIADELPAIFLYHPENYFIFSNKVADEIVKIKENYSSFIPE